MCASSCGPARPRAIGCDGAGGWVIAAHARHENFYLPLPRDHLQGLGHVLAQLVQDAAAARTRRRRGVDYALARQMLRQRAARRFLAREGLHRDGRTRLRI
jgi:hypothetical protein